MPLPSAKIRVEGGRHVSRLPPWRHDCRSHRALLVPRPRPARAPFTVNGAPNGLGHGAVGAQQLVQGHGSGEPRGWGNVSPLLWLPRGVHSGRSHWALTAPRPRLAGAPFTVNEASAGWVVGQSSQCSREQGRGRGE